MTNGELWKAGLSARPSHMHTQQMWDVECSGGEEQRCKPGMAPVTSGPTCWSGPCLTPSAFCPLSQLPWSLSAESPLSLLPLLSLAGHAVVGESQLPSQGVPV